MNTITITIERAMRCVDCPTRDYKGAATAPDELEQLRKDAERYRWLAEYLVSDDESHDDAIVAAMTVEELNAVIDGVRGTP